MDARLVRFAREWEEPEFPVKGGISSRWATSPAPLLGDALDELKAHWIAERFELNKDELIARLKAH